MSIALLTVAFVSGIYGIPMFFAGRPPIEYGPLLAVHVVAAVLSGRCDKRRGR